MKLEAPFPYFGGKSGAVAEARVMRCHACGRPLIRAAYTHPSDWTLGPICAEKRRCSAKKKRVKQIKQVARNDDRFDPFSGEIKPAILQNKRK